MARHSFTVCRGLVSCLDKRHVDGAHCMTNRCVEMCMCFVCKAIVVVTTDWRSGFSAIRWSSLLCGVTKGRPGTVAREVGVKNCCAGSCESRNTKEDSPRSPRPSKV